MSMHLRTALGACLGIITIGLFVSCTAVQSVEIPDETEPLAIEEVTIKPIESEMVEPMTTVETISIEIELEAKAEVKTDDSYDITDFISVSDVSALLNLPVELKEEDTQSYGEQLLLGDFSINEESSFDYGISFSVILNKDVAAEQYTYHYSLQDTYNTLIDIEDIGSQCFMALKECDNDRVEQGLLAAIRDGIYYSVTYKRKVGLEGDYEQVLRNALKLIIKQVEEKISNNN